MSLQFRRSRHFHPTDSRGYTQDKDRRIRERKELDDRRDIANKRRFLRDRYPFARNTDECVNSLRSQKLRNTQLMVTRRLDKFGVFVVLKWHNVPKITDQWGRWHAEKLHSVGIPMYVDTVPRTVHDGDTIKIYTQAINLRCLKIKLGKNANLSLVEGGDIENWRTFLHENENTLTKVNGLMHWHPSRQPQQQQRRRRRRR